MHKKLEKLFGKFGGFISNHPIIVILFSLLVIAFPLSQAPKITMDTSTEGFMHESDPMLINYNAFRDQFGRDERIMIALKSDNIFTLPFLTKLQKLHRELEDNLPYLDEVTSLVNVRNVRGEKDQLIVEDLLENFPKTQEDVEKIKKIVMDSEFYKNLLISEDGNMTGIVIETQAYISEEKKSVDEMFDDFDDGEKEIKPEDKVLLSDAQNAEIVHKVVEIVDKYKSDDFDIYYAGSPTVMDALKSMMKTDMQKFTRLTILIVLIFLFSGVVLASKEIAIPGILLEISNDRNRAIYTGISGAGSLSIVVFPLIAGALISSWGFTPIFLFVSATVLTSFIFSHKIDCKLK